ncbi:WD repeat-containing protein 6 [Rhizophlyctis rosea]|nr:WD repeat-containing protein 6 [Rhizophlyctis rosea]
MIEERDEDIPHLRLGNIGLPGEYIKVFSLMALRSIVVCTNLGRFFHRTNQDDAPYTFFHEDIDFGKQTCLRCLKERDIAVAGSMDGHLVLLSCANVFRPIKWKPHAGKINDVFLRQAGDNVHLFSFAGEKEELFWYRIGFNGSEPIVEHVAFLVLPHRTVAMDVDHSAAEDAILVAFRSGAVAVYDGTIDEAQVTSISEVSERKLHASLVRKLVHAKDAVTSVVIDGNASRDGEIVFLTTGRDGNFCRFALRREGGEKMEGGNEGNDGMTVEGGWRLETLLRSRITKGWLEQAVVVDDTLLLCGFYNKRFFVYNETKKFEMFAVHCGGAHRKWEFRAGDASLRNFAFGFVRSLQMRLVSREGVEQDGFADPKIQDSFHGVETRVVRFLGKTAAGSSLVVTSGEDGILKFHECKPAAGAHKVLSDVKKHVSVVRGMSVSKGVYATYLFTAGAREEMACWILDTDVSGIRCLEVASAPFLSSIKETRIMDVSVVPVPGKPGLHLVGTVCSDAFVRVWSFSEDSRRFRLLGASKYHNRCVLKCQTVVVPGGEGRQAGILLVTAGTDGRIAVWDCNGLADSEEVMQLKDPIVVHRAHQSGVNGLHVRLYGVDKIVIASCGDDNAVGVLRIKVAVDAIGACIVKSSAFGTVLSAHSSPASAVRWVSDDTFLSTSLDQRLNAWRVCDGAAEGELQMELVKSYFVDIADISDMDVSVDGSERLQVAVAGFGMEILESVDE